MPVKFRRARGMLALPTPRTEGNVDVLRRFVNFADDDDWRLVAAWLATSLMPSGPYPVLNIHGEQGSARSALARCAKLLIDPNTASLRSRPREERDLVIAATNGTASGEP